MQDIDMLLNGLHMWPDAETATGGFDQQIQQDEASWEEAK